MESCKDGLISFVVSVQPSVPSEELLYGFSLHLILGGFC
jgi:hypothetical protein